MVIFIARRGVVDAWVDMEDFSILTMAYEFKVNLKSG